MRKVLRKWKSLPITLDKFVPWSYLLALHSARWLLNVLCWNQSALSDWKEHLERAFSLVKSRSVRLFWICQLWLTTIGIIHYVCMLWNVHLHKILQYVLQGKQVIQFVLIYYLSKNIIQEQIGLNGEKSVLSKYWQVCLLTDFN